jgi:hypothetical protein
VECRHILVNIFATRYHRFTPPISDEHQVRLLPSHLQILLLVPEIITSQSQKTKKQKNKKKTLSFPFKFIRSNIIWIRNFNQE